MEITKEQSMAYTEVMEALKYMKEEDKKKIPAKVLQYYENYRDKDYNFEFDTSKLLENQNFSNKAKAVLTLLFREYLVTEEERKQIQQEELRNQKQEDLEKQKKYPVDGFLNKNT